MNEMFPLKHNLQDGLYTREILMPKGCLVVSFIHKQNHPSFFMSGEMSVLLDTGEVKRIKAPILIHSDVAERIFGKALGRFFQKKSKRGFDLVQLESPEFEKHFAVYF